ncbi:MAG TPA: hypothetical protein V6C69_11000 [Trichormus sp.]
MAAALKQSFERGDTDGVSLAHRELFMLLKDAGKPIPEDNSGKIVVADSEQMELVPGGVVKMGGAGPQVAPMSQISQVAQPTGELATEPTDESAPVAAAAADFSPEGSNPSDTAGLTESTVAEALSAAEGSTEGQSDSFAGDKGQTPSATPQRDLKSTQDLSTAMRNYQPITKTKRDLAQEMRHFTEATAAQEASPEPPTAPQTGQPDEPKFKQGFMRHAARVQQAAARMAAKIKPGEPPSPPEPASAEAIKAHPDDSQVDTLRLHRQRDSVAAESTADQERVLAEIISVNDVVETPEDASEPPEAAPETVEAASETPEAAPEMVEAPDAQQSPSTHGELAPESEMEILSPESAAGAMTGERPEPVGAGETSEDETTPGEAVAGESATAESTFVQPVPEPAIEPVQASASAESASAQPVHSGASHEDVAAAAGMAAEEMHVDSGLEPGQTEIASASDMVPVQAAVAAAPDAVPEQTFAAVPTEAADAAARSETAITQPEMPEVEAEAVEAPPPRPNIYALLDVSPMSPFDEIHRRFMRKARRVLLDIKKNKALRHQKLAELQKLWIAHDILTDPVTRTDYDFRDLGVRGAPDSVAHPADPQGRMAARTPLRIGELLQCAGLLESNELEIACDMHKAVPDIQFGTFLVRQGFIQERDLESALVGQKLLRVGAITVAQFQVAMDLAQSRGSLIDETLIEKGYISKDDLDHRLNPPDQETIAPPVVQIREIQVTPKSGEASGGGAWKEQLDWGSDVESGTPRQSLGGFLSSHQSAAESNRRQPNYHLDLSSSDAEEPQSANQKPVMNYELDFSSPPPEDMLPSPEQATGAAGESASERQELRLSNAVPNWKDQIDWTASEGEGTAQNTQPEPAADSSNTVTTGDFSAAPVSATGDFDVVPLEHAQALEAAQAQVAQNADEQPAIDVNNDMLTAITADGARFEMLSTRSSSPTAETQPIFLKQSEPGFDPGLTPALDAQQQQYWAQNDPGFDQPEAEAPVESAASNDAAGHERRLASQMETLEFMPPQLPPLVISSIEDEQQQSPAEQAFAAGADQSSGSTVPSDTVSSPSATGADDMGADAAQSGFFSHLIGATEIFESSALPLVDADADSNGQLAEDAADKESEEALDGDDDASNADSSQSKGTDRRKRKDTKRRRRR